MAKIVADYTRLSLLTEQLNDYAANIVKGQNRLINAINATKASWVDVGADEARKNAAETASQLNDVVAKDYLEVSTKIAELVAKWQACETDSAGNV